MVESLSNGSSVAVRRTPELTRSKRLRSSPQPGTTLGSRIRELRLKLGLTQDALAQPEFTKSYISAVERDKVRPSLRALTLLAARLGESASTLLQAHMLPADDPVSVLGGAEASILAGDPAAATSLLQAPLQAEHETARLLLLARALAAAGTWDQASEVARELLATGPDAATAAQARYLLGCYLDWQQQPLAALAEHKAATGASAVDRPLGAELPPELRSTAITQLLTGYIALGRQEDLARLIARVDASIVDLLSHRVQQYAKDSASAFLDGRAQLGGTLLAQARAVAAARSDLLLAAHASLVAGVDSGAQQDEREHDTLREVLTVATLAGSSQLAAEALLRLADQALGAGDHEHAQQLANRVLQLDPSDLSAHARSDAISGRVASATGRHREADEFMTRALDRVNAAADAHLRAEIAALFAEMLTRRGEHERATHYYRLALTRDSL